MQVAIVNRGETRADPLVPADMKLEKGVAESLKFGFTA